MKQRTPFPWGRPFMGHPALAIVAGSLAFAGSLPATEILENGSFENNNGFDGINSGFSWTSPNFPNEVFDVYNYTTQIWFTGPAPMGGGRLVLPHRRPRKHSGWCDRGTDAGPHFRRHRTDFPKHRRRVVRNSPSAPRSPDTYHKQIPASSNWNSSMAPISPSECPPPWMEAPEATTA